MGHHVVFLECKRFHTMFPDVKCCESCHGGTNDYGVPHLIHVHPYCENKLNIDWELHIEAIVCCHFYHSVRQLSREWWLNEARVHNVRYEQVEGYIYPDSPQKDVVVRRGSKTGQRKQAQSIDEEYSFEDFLGGK